MIQGTLVREEQEFVQSYCRPFSDQDQACEDKITAYLGPGKTPEWLDEAKTHSENNLNMRYWKILTNCRQVFFQQLLTIVPDSTSIKHATCLRSNELTGKTYLSFNFSIGIKIGLTEISAQVIWKVGVSHHTCLVIFI